MNTKRVVSLKTTAQQALYRLYPQLARRAPQVRFYLPINQITHLKQLTQRLIIPRIQITKANPMS